MTWARPVDGRARASCAVSGWAGPGRRPRCAAPTTRSSTTSTVRRWPRRSRRSPLASKAGASKRSSTPSSRSTLPVRVSGSKRWTVACMLLIQPDARCSRTVRVAGPRPSRRARARLRASSTSVRSRGSGEVEAHRAVGLVTGGAVGAEARREAAAAAQHRARAVRVGHERLRRRPRRPRAPTAARRRRARARRRAGRPRGRPARRAAYRRETASLSPVPGSATTCTPRVRHAGREARVARHEHELVGSDRLERRGERVGRDGGAEVGAVRADGAGEARLAVAVSLTGTTTCQSADGSAGGCACEEVVMLAISSHSPPCCSTPRREVDKMKPSHVDRRAHDEEDVTP